MSLKDLTHAKHKEAETQPFVKVLFSGKINPDLYATFLFNQHPVYELLETYAMMFGLVNDLPDIRRGLKINEDFRELWGNRGNKPVELAVTRDYLDHIKMLAETNPNALFSHIYVRHMGDLAGGQMISKRVPGSGRMYQFADPDALKTAIRARLSDDMADEANVCFDFAARMFKEMMEVDLPHFVESESADE
jgi:heme oxygenase